MSTETWWVRPILAEEYDEIRKAPRMLAVKGAARPIALVLDEARAPMLAAAPALYAALEAVGSCGECGEDYGRCMKCDARIVAALALAKGEQGGEGAK